MKYEFLARVQTKPPNKARCIAPSASNSTATIKVTGATETWITWVAGTNYNINAGDAENDFSFEGPDPHKGLVKDLALATSKTYADIRQIHLDDYEDGLTSKFSLDLGQTPDFSKATDEQVEAYTADKGNVHLEWVLFNYGRYMLFTSGRGVLPSNLQGVWARDTGAPWSGDYHANINTQMNYWAAETTDIDVTASLWDYMLKTWVPRGEQTASILYNTKRGWATHNEMNIFGHTGMKAFPPWNSAQWANYPLAGAWMMVQVIDHLDYGLGDLKWWRTQGWPLLKGTAEFWLDNIFVDLRHDDGTMVVNPCNSPEQIPVTLGCAHHQQIIWEIFNGIEKGFEYSGDSDVRFLADVRAKKARLDRGLHIGSWGQLQEWKIDKDLTTDTHRHLSHLYGLYPGYAVASYPDGGEVVGLSRSKLLNATRVSLEARGIGTGPDGDAGWEKVWRAACWAQLGEPELFYWQFKYAVERNFGWNLFSLYNPFSYDPIFQIDANLGAPAAVMNALLQAPDTASFSSPLTITILPALPSAWSAKGSLKGARVRGGIGISFSWVKGKPKDIVLKFDRVVKKAGWTREIRVVVGGGSDAKEIDRFIGKAGLVRKVKV
ncbi:hypothetical protein FRC03_009021 [Tulasnella sp. 419]|nr:hypothetical protein FRC03_009021 [Tulasnella sp. 419]